MREIKKKRKTLNVHTEKYLVTAVPLFYSESQENEFKTEWENTLADQNYLQSIKQTIPEVCT